MCSFCRVHSTRIKLLAALSGCKFFSLQADASTDADNCEDELFLVLYFDPHSSDGKVHVRDRFFCVRQLSSGTAKGLFECLKGALTSMGVMGWQKKLIGFGCNGCNANMGKMGGLKELLQQDL